MAHLTGLISEGRFDSEGRFELSFRDSRKRYATLVEGEREAFLRLLIQAILASGSTRIDVVLTRKRCQLNWSPQSPASWGEFEMKHILDYLVGEPDVFVSPALQLAKLGCVLTSCRQDLRLELGFPDVDRILAVDADGVRSEEVKEVISRPFIRLNRIGARPAGNRPRLWEVDLYSPILSWAWPEMYELKKNLFNLTAPLFVNKSPWNVDALDVASIPGSRTIRRAYIHPDPAQNNLSVTTSGTRVWGQKKPQPIYQAWNGERVVTPPGMRLPVYFAAEIHTDEMKDSENNIRLHDFRILKYGVPIFVSQDFAPTRMRVVIDGSHLPTDASSRQVVRGEELEKKLLEALELMMRAVLATRDELESELAERPSGGGTRGLLRALKEIERDLERLRSVP